MSLLSFRAYARLRKISHTAVVKAVKRGRLSTVNGKIDPALADQEWLKNTQHLKRRGPGPVFEPLPLIEGRPTVQAPPIKREAVWEGMEDWKPMAIPEKKPATVVVMDNSLISAKTRVEVERFKRLERENAVAEGRLIDAEAARLAFVRMGRIMRAGVEKLPTLLAPALVGGTDPRKLEDLVRSAIREALQSASDEIGSRFPQFVSNEKKES